MTSLPIPLPVGFVPQVTAHDSVVSGQVLAKKDAPQDVVVNIMESLQLSRKDAKKALQKSPGDTIVPGDTIAVKKSAFGKVKGRIVSQISGIILRYERDTGNLFVRTDLPPSALELISPVAGTVVMCNNKEIRIETNAAFVSEGIALGTTGEGQLFILKESFDTDSSDNALYYLDSRAEGKIVLVHTISRDIIVKGDSIGAAGFLGVNLTEDEIDYLQKRDIQLPILEITEELASQLSAWENKKVLIDVGSKAIVLRD
ncbi:MAG TPA: hypothetical protein VLF93_04340 [Candidatus Saccharimonadales bacterium]|nr:hypothetical protein [Candidatus Saccharimonadales bacterium]